MAHFPLPIQPMNNKSHSLLNASPPTLADAEKPPVINESKDAFATVAKPVLDPSPTYSAAEPPPPAYQQPQIQIKYIDNAPRPAYLEKHILALTGLTVDDFLPMGHFEKFSSNRLVANKLLKYGGTTALGSGIIIGAVAGTISASAATFGAPIALAAAAVPVALGFGALRSKGERQKYVQVLKQMKSALDASPDLYGAYLRTGLTSFRNIKKAKQANEAGWQELTNYMESKMDKSVLWRIHFPIASNEILVVTTVDAEKARHLFRKAATVIAQRVK